MKFNKKLLSLTVLGTLGLITFAPSSQAATSKANVTFTQPTSAPKILDPDTPDGPALAPDELEAGGEVTNERGVLTLDYVSNLNFGSNELSFTAQSLSAENTKTPFAQVTDVRGTGAGWRLIANLGDFTTDEGTTTSLPGAEIVLIDGKATADTYTRENFDAPDVEQDITLSSGNQADVTTAIPTEENTPGMGTWLTHWNNEDITLNIPAGVATQGTHTAEITWTLYNAPTGTEVEPLYNNTEGNEEPGE